MSTFEEQVQQVKSANFVPWKRLHQLLDACQSNREQIHECLNLVCELYARDLTRVKCILAERARHCDSLIARLQFLEAQESQQLEPTIAQCALETADPEESALSRALTEECPASKVFDFDPSRSLLRLQPSGMVAIACYAVYHDEGAQTTFSDPVAELQAQNQQNLALGLEWKRKYERAQEELKQIATERANEMQELYQMINSLPVGRGSKQ
jgi:hypothetical protein